MVLFGAQAGAVYSSGVYLGGARASLSILLDDSIGAPRMQGEVAGREGEWEWEWEWEWEQKYRSRSLFSVPFSPRPPPLPPTLH
jgi:hypothetical protein